MALILFQPKEEFAHRINKNGTADSICLHCFMTAATSPKEDGLGKIELTHGCWQRDGFTVRVQPTRPAINSPWSR